MVYEDALIILSYASPYEVEIEAKSNNTKSLIGSVGQGAQPQHPVYRSSSSSDIVTVSAYFVILKTRGLFQNLNKYYRINLVFLFFISYNLYYLLEPMLE